MNLNQNWATQTGYQWSWSLILNGKTYTSVSTGTNNAYNYAKIPTIDKIAYECSSYQRDFYYWTSSDYLDGTDQKNYKWCVFNTRRVHYKNKSESLACLPFIRFNI